MPGWTASLDFSVLVKIILKMNDCGLLDKDETDRS